MGRKQGTPSARALVAAFAAVAVCFLVSTVVSELSNVKIRRDAALITGNAAPSIVHLEAFRSEARRLVVLADDEVDRSVERQRRRAEQPKRPGRISPADRSPAPPPEVSPLPGSLARLDDEWRAYRSLPAFPAERSLAAMVDDIKDRIVADLGRALAAARSGDAGAALDVLDRRIKPAADALDDATVKLVERNAQEATRLASRIDRLGRRSIAFAIGLDGVSVLLTIVAAFLVLGFLRRYTRLVDQRADQLEQFAGRVAHDVLSPLGAVSLALSYLTEEAVIEDPRARRMLALGRRGVERTRLIADDLLAFASAGARPDPEARADVGMVIAAVIDEARALAEERQVALSTDGTDAGSVRCAQGILSSVVSNLVRNGVKYVGEGPGKRVTVRARRAGAVVRIEVEDNGPGLPVAMEASVFEPYVRGPDNHQPGIGLGLATVKLIAEAHGGRVDVRSVAGAGCRFLVELPSARAAAEGEVGAAREKALPPPGNAPRVGAEDERRRDISSEDTNPSSQPG